MASKVPDSVKEAARPLIEAARLAWGEPKYKYYAIPVSWRGEGKRGRYRHWMPVTGLEHYEVTEEKWRANNEQSIKDSTSAFMGDLKHSYTKYERKIIKDGWREKLIEALKDGVLDATNP